ncbi:exodeoxyribonuclease VII large subunit [uncultured Rhodospira sp.]|uniref:exodeoxyribonuclease VII large subunit n=1 Tax=uncultured Rhodospira sp. TaxID=1936189 RepID=UPI00261FE9A2|nr:exodeoxyribonuclease VII large subunit [uncultured Rhodospira sp.]
MTTEPDAPSTAHNLPEVTVSELSQSLKRTVEDAFGRVRVRGEISQPKVAGSGHCYLRLKDDQAVLDGIVWRGTLSKLSVRPEEGLEVIATGRLTTYPGRSSYQIIIESLDLAGEGALLKMLEERKRRLAAEGLFATERKRRLPFLPRVVGVVTSPTGAVIRDILHRLNDRFPVHVLVWPVRVQGEEAAGEVRAAIEGFNALAPDGPVPRPDVLIVARGGGSLEDLMAFNDEAVVRAAAASSIPLVSAVGHETDTTLIDFAADLRAPTPTGAAEMVVPVRLDLMAQVSDDGRRLLGAMGRLLEDRAARLTGLARGLPDLGRLVEDQTQRLDDRAQRLALAWPTLLERRHAEVDRLFARLRSPRELVTLRASELRHLGKGLDGAARRAVADSATRLDAAARLLESYSFRKVLERGFVLVRDAGDDRPVTAAASVTAGQGVTLQFADGRVGATIGGAAAEPAPSTPAPSPAPSPRRPAGKRGKASDTRQGDLLDGL